MAEKYQVEGLFGRTWHGGDWNNAMSTEMLNLQRVNRSLKDRAARLEAENKRLQDALDVQETHLITRRIEIATANENIIGWQKAVKELQAENAELRLALKSAHDCARRISRVIENGNEAQDVRHTLSAASQQAEHIMRIAREALPPDSFSLLREAPVGQWPKPEAESLSDVLKRDDGGVASAEWGTGETKPHED